VVRRFPNTEYAEDAKLKIELARDHLAGKEMTVGRFYLTNKEYLAAVNRFRAVVDQFETTSHVPEALHRMVEAYTAMGIQAEARKSAAVLAYNYPDSEWYDFSYALIEGRSIASVRRDAAKEVGEDGLPRKSHLPPSIIF
ncbi:MAG: outer membrane protein assembly factor BamD, partial [Proteobacteria bacterium]|nr:outer membrane protein assembly factor BamD [Pseudomonadota bacterium]